MQLTVIGTGSTGNSYCLKHDNDTLLLDLGVTMDKIYKALNFNLSCVDGCVVSHFHNDHCRSVQAIANQFIPVMLSNETQKDLNITSPMLITKNNVTFKNWYITGFKLEHDSDNTGFLILHKPTNTKIAYITDTGYIKVNLSDIDILITECNFVDEIISEQEQDELKDRIRTTHMSLNRLSSYLRKIDVSRLKHIVLVHLSETNSDKNIIYDTLHKEFNCKIHLPIAKETVELN